MIKTFYKIYTLVTAIVVLASMLYWFFCTELGKGTFEKQSSGTQDYCEIVNVTKAKVGKALTCNLFKLKGEKSFCPHFINEINTNCTSLYKLDTAHFQKTQVTITIYLYNRAFLI